MPENHAAAEPQHHVVPTDAVGAVFRRRWEQECTTSLLLAEEVRNARALVAQQQAVIEQLKKRLEEKEAKDGGTA